MILVAYCSRHGATAGIAERITSKLGDDAQLRHVNDVDSLAPYDAVVFGSPVYDGSWPPEGAEFVQRHGAELAAFPVWLFSVGAFGDTKRMLGSMMKREPRNIAKVLARVQPRDYRVFAGVIQRSQWPWFGRLLFWAFGGRFGDNRDWPAIEAWAATIAAELPVAARC